MSAESEEIHALTLCRKCGGKGWLGAGVEDECPRCGGRGIDPFHAGAGMTTRFRHRTLERSTAGA
jgi:DnaJ-class molecular chaperone